MHCSCFFYVAYLCVQRENEERIARERSEAAAGELRAAGALEQQLRAQLRQAPEDAEQLKAELAACVMARAVKGMVAELEDGTVSPKSAGVCCVNQLVREKMHTLLEAVDDKYPELIGSPASHVVAVDAIARSSMREAAAAPCSTCCSISGDAWTSALAVALEPTVFGANPSHLDGTDFRNAVRNIHNTPVPPFVCSTQCFHTLARTRVRAHACIYSVTSARTRVCAHTHTHTHTHTSHTSHMHVAVPGRTSSAHRRRRKHVFAP